MRPGERIRKIRKELGWTLKRLSQESGVPVSTISDLEHGRSTNPTGDTLVKLATALKAGTDWAQTGKGVPVRQEAKIADTELSRIYKLLSPTNQEALIATARALLGAQGGELPDLDGDIPRLPPPKH